MCAPLCTRYLALEFFVAELLVAQIKVVFNGIYVHVEVVDVMPAPWSFSGISGSVVAYGSFWTHVAAVESSPLLPGWALDPVSELMNIFNNLIIIVKF